MFGLHFGHIILNPMPLEVALVSAKKYVFHWLIGKLLGFDWTELLINIQVFENLSLPQ